MARSIPASEVSQHATSSDTWLVVNGKVFNITDFAPEHPGGAEIIYRYAGKDASKVYNENHAPSLIEKTLPPKDHIGVFDSSVIPQDWQDEASETTAESTSDSVGKPALDDIINLQDFEDVASRTLSAKAWAYISGASNDNITRDANIAMLRRIWFRPSILRNVGTVNTKTNLFGCNLDIPVYISPTGAVVMAGPEGELAQAKAAATSGVIQCVSTPASYPHHEIVEVTPQHLFFQLYVNKERAKSEAAIRQVTASGKVKAIFVTVDLPVVSKREADERVKPPKPLVNPNLGTANRGRDKKGAGLARSQGSFIDPTFDWESLAWLRRITNLPIVLKGIQRFEDARRALQVGCDGIVLSNHGGRAADNAQPGILTLLELHKNCPEVFGRMEILVDGGFRRGSDVVKAICLGASAVGIGRPFLYAVNYGQEGVEHAISILQDEIEVAMRLCGMTDLMRDASPDYLNTAELDWLVPNGRHPYARKVVKGESKL